MTVTVEIKGVKDKLSPQAMDRGQMAMGNQMLSDMNMFIPMRDNILRQTGHLSSDNKTLIWSTLYAKKQFYIQASNYTTPGTGPRWDLKAKGMFLSDWQQAFLKGSGIN